MMIFWLGLLMNIKKKDLYLMKYFGQFSVLRYILKKLEIYLKIKKVFILMKLQNILKV